jgi:hypothetical protein
LLTGPADLFEKQRQTVCRLRGPGWPSGSRSGTVYNPELREGEGVDRGLLVRAANPFNERKSVLVIAGSFGYGTWAGARLAIEDTFLKRPMVAAQTPFECLFETDVVGEAPQATKITLMRPLGS